MYLETIRQTLFPRFENISFWKSEDLVNNLRKNFNSHCQLLSDFIEKRDLDNLNIDFFVELHKLFYPAWFEIKATGNDWVFYVMKPGEFRKQYLSKYIDSFSETRDIEKDFQKIIDNFNNLLNKTREDILKFYIDFWKVHPFWDSNWTISILVCDVLCVKYWYKPINILKIRFKNKNFWFELVKKLEKEKYSSQSLWEVLKLIDEFNQKN